MYPAGFEWISKNKGSNILNGHAAKFHQMEMSKFTFHIQHFTEPTFVYPSTFKVTKNDFILILIFLFWTFKKCEVYLKYLEIYLYKL